VVSLESGMAGEDAPMLARLANSAVIARSERHNGTLAVTAHCASARDFVPAAFDAARSEGATIQHVEVVPVSLEDVFISLTGRALRE
jgi:ABC-2 type transport system ATP-binding protein